MTRKIKQIVYSIIYIVVIFGIIIGLYFFIKPNPSCFDGKQNQDEEGIDCGGSCAIECRPEFKPIELVDHVFVLPVGAGRITILAQIKNENLNYAAKNFNFTFSIYNNSDQILKTINNSSFIYSGEIKYLAIPNLEINLGDVSRAELEIDSPKWVESDVLSRPEVKIQNKNIGEESNNIRVEGNLVNNDPFSLPSVKVVAVFFSPLGIPKGTSQTEISNLAPREVRSFRINHPPINGVDIPATQIFVFASRD